MFVLSHWNDFNKILILKLFKSKKNDLQKIAKNLTYSYLKQMRTEPEFNEFESRLKSAKNQFQWSASLNLET